MPGVVDTGYDELAEASASIEAVRGSKNETTGLEQDAAMSSSRDEQRR